MRHKQLVCEMELRGYRHRSPMDLLGNSYSPGLWPQQYVDHPSKQFQLLKEKYRDKKDGRIPLPRNEQQLWSQHKYSVLARSPEIYRKIGSHVARGLMKFDDLSLILVEILREQPPTGGIRNALQHMWGYVSNSIRDKGAHVSKWSLRELLFKIQDRAKTEGICYLLHSTALSDLMVWL